jgi:HD-like signal output (HDOD) protein
MYGLFCDCGIPIMQKAYPEYTSTLIKANMGFKSDFTNIEDEAHTTNHTAIGYLLAKNWSLPNSICQAVLNHHDIAILQSEGNSSAQVRGLIALYTLSEFLCDSRQLRDVHDWDQSGPVVLSYLGLSGDEFNEIRDEVFQLRFWSSISPQQDD